MSLIKIGLASGESTPTLTVSETLYESLQAWFGGDGAETVAVRAGTDAGLREYSLRRDLVEYIVAVVEEAP